MILPHPAHVGELARQLIVLAGIIDLIIGIFVGVGQAIIDIAAAVAAAVAAVWSFLAPILVSLWHTISALWNSVLRVFFSKVKDWFTQLRAWWEKWAKPVTDLFKKIHEYERILYDATFGPILDTISNLQKLLNMLGLAHTALGEALHEVLNNIGNLVQQFYFDLTGPVNEVISRIEGYILDVNGLLKSDLLLGSVFANFGKIWNVWWTKSVKELTPSGREQLKKYGTRKPFNQIHTDLLKAVRDNSGPIAELIAPAEQTFLQRLKDEDPEWYQAGEPEVK